MNTELKNKDLNSNDAKPMLCDSAFEYRVVDHDMFDQDEISLMNNMGAKGWEIIRILDPMNWLNSDGKFIRIYYKRVKKHFT